MIRSIPCIAALSLILAASAPAKAPDSSTSENRVRAHVEFLADDLLEGRGTGERGHDIAAVYVAAHFRSLGLKPGGENGGWYQIVPFRRATTTAAAGALISGQQRSALQVGRDIVVEASLTERDRRIETDLVFVGYGIHEPRLGIDDYRGLDVRGKTVVVLGGTPEGLSSEIRAHLGATKSDVAAARGAIGFIDLSRQRGQGSRRYVFHNYQEPTVDWVGKDGRAGSQPAGLRFRAAISESLANRLFEGAPRNLSSIRAQASRKGARPAGFRLRARLAIEASSAWQDFQSREVIGVLPGADPTLRDEHVILMGHLDHLGKKPNAKPGEDAIYNGALDNASGVATMLEAAHQFATSDKPPRRSVMFIANTGEELGLLGADYYARHPTVPIRQIVGAVDLDMPVPLYDFNDVIAFGAEHSTVARNVERAARSMGITVSPDPMVEQAIFVRSDHYQFVRQGVPAILLFTGYGNGGKAKWNNFFENIYHKPNDDLSLPINWRAAARYAELNYRISRALADADARPLWYQGDYFADLYAPGQPRASKVN